MSILIKTRNNAQGGADLARIEYWLQRICPHVTINRTTRLVEYLGKPPTEITPGTDCIALTECQTLYAIIHSPRICRVEPRVAGGGSLGQRYPGTYPDQGDNPIPMNSAGDASISSTSDGLKQGIDESSNDGPGADVRLYLDITDNYGEGYPTSNYPWVVLKHMLGSGLAYQFMFGQASRSRQERHNNAVACENRYRADIGLQPRTPDEVEDEVVSPGAGFTRIVDRYTYQQVVGQPTTDIYHAGGT